MWVARAGDDPRLPQLPIDRLDAEAPAIAFADFGRRAAQPPSSKQQLLTAAFLGLVMPVRAVTDTHADRRRLLAAPQRMLVPASLLPFDRVQARPRSAFLRLAAAVHHGHQEREPFRLQPGDHR